tara:strand:+ start:1924 stop:2034 length:111 start_codon:yes stop_codon:yes gene_type:complete
MLEAFMYLIEIRRESEDRYKKEAGDALKINKLTINK